MNKKTLTINFWKLNFEENDKRYLNTVLVNLYLKLVSLIVFSIGPTAFGSCVREYR